MRFGDTKYHHYNTHGPIYQLWNVASVYQESRWQWLAGRMSDAGVGIKDRMGWSSLLWYDPGIPDDIPAELTTAHLFEDTGWFTSRSSWDSDAIMVGFKCGPFHGAAVQDLYDQMTSFHQLVNGHVPPDVYHFNLYAVGQWLVGYAGFS